MNPWTIQPQYAADFDKIKCLEFTLTPGKTVYVPAYWWYSITFHKNTSISSFKYRTYMNNLAISPYIGMHILQLQNIKRNYAASYFPLPKSEQKIENVENVEKIENVENVEKIENVERNNIVI